MYAGIVPQVCSAREITRFASVISNPETSTELKAASEPTAGSDPEVNGKLSHSIATIPLIGACAHDKLRAPETSGLLFEAFTVQANDYIAPWCRHTSGPETFFRSTSLDEF
jgi:hypothetical protein